MVMRRLFSRRESLLVLASLPLVSPVVAETRHLPGPDERARLINPLELAARMSREKIWLFDVRDAPEFDVSHLKSARRLSPTTDSGNFVAEAGARSRGARFVFYCTTNGRSHTFADSVHHDLIEAGAKRVEVLAGGLIAWANADLPLVTRRGSTRFVHPFDPETARHLKDPGRIRYQL